MLFREIQWRNPFEVDRLAFPARCYRRGYGESGRSLPARLIRRGARGLVSAMFGGRIDAGSTMKLTIDGRSRIIKFNSYNTQFHSIYLPQYRNGTEPHIAALLDVLIPDDGVFYDIGSNWGYYSLYIGSRPGFRGRVEAFEPMKATFDDLRSVVDQAGLGRVVTCHNLGISSASRSARMVVPDGVHSGMAMVDTSADGGGGGFPVELRPLEDLGLPDPSAIKLDVENHEIEVLAGAEPILRRARPMIVFENWLPRDDLGSGLKPLFFLEKLGYRLFLPVWWDETQSGAGGRFLQPGTYLPARSLKALALFPYSIEQRVMMEERLDLFACHSDRLGSLETTSGFREVPLDSLLKS